MIHPRPVFVSLAQYQDELASGQLSVLDVVERAHHFGADGVEFRKEPWPGYRQELPAVRARLAELGLQAVLASFNCIFDASALSGQSLCNDILLADELGARLLRVFPGAVPVTDGRPAWQRAQAFVDDAAAHGITVVLENRGAAPGNTLGEIQRILEAIPLPALKTNVDVGNYALYGQDVAAAVRDLAPRIAYCHLKDQTADPAVPPTYLGGGDLPLLEILDELDCLPQPVAYCFEFVGGGEPDERIVRSLSYLRARRTAGRPEGSS